MAPLTGRGPVRKKGRKQLLLPSLPLLHFFALVPFFARPKPEISFFGLPLLRNQETLATQATRSAVFLGYEGLRSRVRVGVRIRVRLGVRVRIRVRERRKAKGKIRKIGWSDFNIVSVRLSCRQLGFPGLLGQCISVTYLN